MTEIRQKTEDFKRIVGQLHEALAIPSPERTNRDRNLAIHVYREEWAEDLFSRLPLHLGAFNQVLHDLPTVPKG